MAKDASIPGTWRDVLGKASSPGPSARTPEPVSNPKPRSNLTPGDHQNDRALFDRLVRSHDPAMRSTAWRVLGSADAIESALLDAYEQAYRSRDQREEAGDPAASWLQRIVVKTCVTLVDHRRSVRRGQPDPARFELASDGGEMANQALRAIPGKLRVALVLIDCEGYSSLDVAQSDRGFNPLHMIVTGPSVFVKQYLLRGGIRDGWPGFVWSFTSAWSVTLRDWKRLRKALGKDY